MAMTKPKCSRLPWISFGNCASAITFGDCGQPRPIGSLSGPSSSMLTNSRTMKLSSSVVTTSSTPKRVFSSVGPSSVSAPPSIAGEQQDRNQQRRTAVAASPVPSTTVMTAPI